MKNRSLFISSVLGAAIVVGALVLSVISTPSANALVISPSSTPSPLNANISLDPSSPLTSTVAVTNTATGQYLGLPVLVFDVRAQGGDLALNTVKVNITSPIGGSSGSIGAAYLYQGSQLLGSASVQNGVATFTSLSNQAVIPVNATVPFMVKADITNVGSGPGFSVSASVVASGVTVMSASGASANVTVQGSASGNKITVVGQGPVFSLSGTPTISESVTVGGTAATFVVTFNVQVTADGSPIILGLPSSKTPAFPAYGSNLGSWVIYKNGVAVDSSVNYSPTVSYIQPPGTALSSDGTSFTIAQNQTVTIPVTLRFVVPVLGTDVYGVRLNGVDWLSPGNTIPTFVNEDNWATSNAGYGSTAANLHLIAPAAGAVIPVGSMYTIQWSATPATLAAHPTADILLEGFTSSGCDPMGCGLAPSKNIFADAFDTVLGLHKAEAQTANYTAEIASNISLAQGHYTWAIPADITSRVASYTGQYKIYFVEPGTTKFIAPYNDNVFSFSSSSSGGGGGGSTGNCYVFTRDLTIGSNGDDVAALQTWLMNNGFTITALESGLAKGYYGYQTAAALALYQQSVGLPHTGYFGSLTRASVMASCNANLTSSGSGSSGSGVTSSGSSSGGGGFVCPAGWSCTQNGGSNGGGSSGVSTISSLASTVTDGSTLVAQSASDFTGHAGSWGVFTAGSGVNDQTTNNWHWWISLSLNSTKTIKSIAVYHTGAGAPNPATNPEGWTTASPDDLGRSSFPLVVLSDGVNPAQLNTAYNQTLGTYGPGKVGFNLYGHVETGHFYGGIVVVNFTDGTRVVGNIPASQYSPSGNGSTDSNQPIVITNVQFSPEKPQVNQWVSGIVTVKNTGSTDWTTPFQVDLNGLTVTVQSLGAGQQTTVTVPSAFTFSYPGPESIKTVIIYPIVGTSEGNTGNVYTGSIMFANAAPYTYASPTPVPKTDQPTTVVCPTGYICTPPGATYTCPSGYTCTPVYVNCPPGYTCMTAPVPVQPTQPAQPVQPVISSVWPTSGTLGTTVTVTGTGFASTDYVEFMNNGIVSGLGGASLSSVSPTQLTFTINSFFMSHMQTGTYQLGVAPSYGGTVTKWINFTVNPVPTATASPSPMASPVSYDGLTCPVGYDCSGANQTASVGNSSLVQQIENAINACKLLGIYCH
ncbi:MAG: peptidoglycan-binding protein [Patescibacteria group bacterium]|nr:peptidoglycan-binding protein [Patescibacteria group bacterium]MDE1940915.1 peptidoglycan-binding protein [Patescibacteria group bacterium]MDE1966709.1 peptidoglycan-binding protein [Patescibacteria group bacterium]